MKKLTLLSSLLVVLLLQAHFAQAQQLQWYKQLLLGTTTGSTIINRDMAYDGSGNLYVVGSFTGTVNFGDGINRTSSGIDFFFIKYSSTGSLTQFNRIGTNNARIEPRGISIFSQNGSVYLYVSGIFTSTNGQILTINFNPNGNTPLTMNDINGDAFIAKYNMNTGGSCMWATRVTNTDANLSGGKIGVDSGGEAYFASSVYNIQGGLATLKKYSGTSGAQIFSTSIGSNGIVNDIGVSGGSVFVCGYQLGSKGKPLAWFSTSTGTTQNSSGPSASTFEDLTLDVGTGIYVMRVNFGVEKYTSTTGSSTPVWSHYIGSWEYFSDIALTGNSQSEVVVAIRYQGTYTFPGGSVTSSLNGTDQDILAIRLNSNTGVPIWAGMNSNAPGTGSEQQFIYPLLIAANPSLFSIVGLIETETIDIDFCEGTTYVTGNNPTEYIAAYSTGSAYFNATISGPDLICESNSVTYTLQNVTPGSIITWSASPANLVTISTGTGSSFTTSAIGSASGNVTITAQVGYNCGVGGNVSKNVLIGKPASLCAPNYILEPCETLYVTTCSSSTLQQYNWYIDNVLVETSDINYEYISLIAHPLSSGQHTICVAGQNQCGESTKTCTTFNTGNCNANFLTVGSAYPNPATATLNFTIENSDSPTLPYDYSYHLFDKGGFSSKSATTNKNTFTIDVSDILKGEYYLKILLPGNNKIQQKIIVN